MSKKIKKFELEKKLQALKPKELSIYYLLSLSSFLSLIIILSIQKW